MTLDEKTTFITGQPGRCVGVSGGVDRLGVPQLCLEDGPAGVRPVLGVSQFPSGHTAAATFDRELIYQRSKSMGQEFFDQGVHIALAPVTGGPLGRSPRGGRNWEGYFADPYATGVAAYEAVTGLQDAGTMATSKHWIAYEQDTYRDGYDMPEAYDPYPENVQMPVSSNVDDKATHELYMWGFAEAVRAGTSYVMCSYNEVNGTHSCANAYTQNNLLKGELNFQGAIMSDWGADWPGDAEFINGGLDFSMPGWGDGESWGRMWGSGLIECVKNGTVSEERITDAALRVLTPHVFSGQVENPPPNVTFNAMSQYYDYAVEMKDVRKPNTADLIRTIGEDAATLVKNVNSALPLSKPKRIGIFGSDAGPNTLSPFWDATGGTANFPWWNDNGTFALGGGSGWAIPPYIVTPYEPVNYRGRKAGAQVYALFNDTAYNTIAATAPLVDIALVFVSAYTAEGQDRPNLYLDHDGEKLINTVAANCTNTIVVIHSGGPVLVEDWFDNDNVTAVVVAHMPGQESGDSIASVLFGDVSPSGRMPYTTAKSLDDYPPDTIVEVPTLHPQSYFNESTLIDYRWFSAKNITPRFEFGFGLSYSSFSYANIQLDDVYEADHKAIQTTNEPFEGYAGSNSLYDVVVKVKADITNTGNVTASEVAQLYLISPESEGVWLRGFDKLKNLAPGETRTATFPLRRKDLSLWSVEKQLWYIPEGDIKVQVGSSSIKLLLSTAWSSSVLKTRHAEL